MVSAPEDIYQGPKITDPPDNGEKAEAADLLIREILNVAYAQYKTSVEYGDMRTQARTIMTMDQSHLRDYLKTQEPNIYKAMVKYDLFDKENPPAAPTYKEFCDEYHYLFQPSAYDDDYEYEIS